MKKEIIVGSNDVEQKRLNDLVISLVNRLNEALQKIQELLHENESLKSSLQVSKKKRYCSFNRRR